MYLLHKLCVIYEMRFRQVTINVDVCGYESSPYNLMIEMGIGRHMGYQPLFEGIVAKCFYANYFLNILCFQCLGEKKKIV